MENEPVVIVSNEVIPPELGTALGGLKLVDASPGSPAETLMEVDGIPVVEEPPMSWRVTV